MHAYLFLYSVSSQIFKKVQYIFILIHKKRKKILETFSIKLTNKGSFVFQIKKLFKSKP